ncbi:ADP-heptose:LPS heptosyltransferase [Thiovulum sp. ES]|nr:ADP-heptose:LPS heptosyltransferase [Thiovulum sp. ES]
MKVIFINTSNIGDLISCLGYAKKISEDFEKSYFVTREGHEAILCRENWVTTVSKEEILKMDFDFVYDFSSSKVSRKIVKIAKSKEKIGFVKNRLDAFFSPYTKTRKRKSGHIVKGYDLIGTETQIPQLTNVKITENDEVAIHIGARNPIRNIPIFLVEQIIDFLLKNNKKIYIFGDSKEDLERLKNRFDVEIFSGDLYELKKLLSQISLFIGSDSGPLHISTALGTKSIGFFGPNIPENSAPLQNIEIVQKKLSCRPCNQNLVCPRNIECLKTLDFKKDILPKLETSIK